MLKGKRKMTLYMPIDLHEDVKALANAAKPPMTQGDVTVQLMRAGLKTLCEKNVPAVDIDVKDGTVTGEHEDAPETSIAYINEETEKEAGADLGAGI